MNMKKSIFTWFSLLIAVLLLSSCSADKKLYSSGYHVNWKYNDYFHKGQTEQQLNELTAEVKQKETQVEEIESELEVQELVSDQLDREKEDDKNSEEIASIKKGVKFLPAVKVVKKTISTINEVANTSFPSLSKRNRQSDDYIAGEPTASSPNIFAILGFSFSILGFLLILLTGLPFFMGTLGVIFSSIGLSKSDEMGGKGFGIAGLIVGIIDIIIFWIIVFVVLTFLSLFI